MSEHSDNMARLLAADAPMARDLSFEIAVLARIEQRRYRRGIAANVTLAAAAALLLALVMPALQPVWEAGLAAAARTLPNGTLSHLCLGIALTAITLALPLLRMN